MRLMRKIRCAANHGGKFKRNIDHQDFKSAKLTTEKLRSFTYGIFEARIKNPTDARANRIAIPVWPALVDARGQNRSSFGLLTRLLP